MNGETVDQSAFRADGVTYDPIRDKARLGAEMQHVVTVMADGQWHSLYQLAYQVGVNGRTFSEAGVSARIRDLRKPRYGSQTIERRSMGGGRWEYRWAR